MNPTQSEPRTEVSGPSDPRAEASGSTSPKLTPSEPEAQARDVSPTSPPSEPETQARAPQPTKSPNPQSSDSIRNPHSAIGRCRHGLTAVNPAVTRSEKIRFNKFRRAMLDELNPHSMIEQYLTDQMVLHRWKILQCDAAEAAVMRAAVYRDQHPAFNINDGINPKLGELKYNLAQLNTPAKRSDRNDYFLKLGYNAPELDKIHRYRKEHERALDRALKEWDNLNGARSASEGQNLRPTRRTNQPSRAHRPGADFTKRNPSPIDATPDESTTCVRSDPRATRPEPAPNDPEPAAGDVSNAASIPSLTAANPRATANTRHSPLAIYTPRSASASARLTAATAGSASPLLAGPFLGDNAPNRRPLASHESLLTGKQRAHHARYDPT